MKKLAGIVAVLVLAGCAVPAVKVGPGPTLVADRIAVSIDDAWNHLPGFGLRRPWTVWTADGVAIDELRFWAGLKEGESIAPSDGHDRRPLSFKATMQPHELVALFASLHARDGSTFTLEKLEPADFVGGKGFRFRYALVRYHDDVRLAGIGWAAVRDGALYAMTFTAPRIGFFPRREKQVEQIAKSARLKG